jgi:hypothetical protein
MRVCSGCGKEVSVEGKVSRRSTCSQCGAYLHACVNCFFHSPGSHNDCREPQADFVRDKSTANFCEFFQFKESKGFQSKGFQSKGFKESPGFREGGGRGSTSARDKRQEARERFDKLFGG